MTATRPQTTIGSGSFEAISQKQAHATDSQCQRYQHFERASQRRTVIQRKFSNCEDRESRARVAKQEQAFHAPTRTRSNPRKVWFQDPESDTHKVRPRKGRVARKNAGFGADGNRQAPQECVGSSCSRTYEGRSTDGRRSVQIAISVSD
jgi:hypothetical protein